MPPDSVNSSTCETASCLGPHLLVLLDGQKSLLDKVETIYQMLKNEKPEAKGSLKKNICRMHVNALVLGLQIEYPDRVWTSDSFAKEIGCTDSAVRHTKAWREYQERLESEKQSRPLRKGHKDRCDTRGGFNADDEDDF